MRRRVTRPRHGVPGRQDAVEAERGLRFREPRIGFCILRIRVDGRLEQRGALVQARFVPLVQ